MWMWYAVGSAVTAALVAVFGKLGLKDIDPTVATTVRGVLMAVILLLAALSFKKFSGFDWSVFGGKAGAFIVLSGLCGAASWLLYFLALKDGPASAVAVIDKLSVVLVVVLAAFFLGETLTWKSLLGALLISLGAVLVIFK